MNIDISDTDKSSGERAAGNGSERDVRPRGGSSALALLALLFALAALAATGWMWWQDRAAAGQERQALAQSLSQSLNQNLTGEIARLEGSDAELSSRLDGLRAELQTLAAADGGEALADLSSAAAADRERLDALEQSLREQLVLSRSLQAATDALHTRLLAVEAGVTQLSARELDAVGELDLAEVDYLLRLANERMQLFSDPEAADRALELADRHLAALDDPAHLGVRQEIAAARRELADLALPDDLQLAARLDEIQAGIARWPFPGDGDSGPVAGAGAAGESGWWARLKSTLASLVTVRRSAEGDPALSLEDKDYVRQRAWLQLEIAHLALMRRDQQAFRSALARVEDLLAAWFDPSDAAVQSAARSIVELSTVVIDPDLPDITAPWNALRLIRRAGAPAASALAPAPEPEPKSEPGQASEPDLRPGAIPADAGADEIPGDPEDADR